MLFPVTSYCNRMITPPLDGVSHISGWLTLPFEAHIRFRFTAGYSKNIRHSICFVATLDFVRSRHGLLREITPWYLRLSSARVAMAAACQVVIRVFLISRLATVVNCRVSFLFRASKNNNRRHSSSLSSRFTVRPHDFQLRTRIVTWRSQLQVTITFGSMPAVELRDVLICSCQCSGKCLSQKITFC